jgi:hypothetical protein
MNRTSPDGLPRLWLWLAVGAASVAAAGSAVGLAAASRIYGSETVALADAAAAQDWVNLLVVSPLVVILGLRARAGDQEARLVWFGCLGFTVYNYAIYAFSIQFGPLFLLWVAVLGLALFALIGGLASADATQVQARFRRRPLRGPAWYLIGAALLFALLWLSEIVPDLLAGTASRSASDWQLPTNPVHVLDLAFFLPALATSGVLLLRRHPWGYLTAPGQLTWLALTCLPILVTPLVAQARDHQPAWGVAVPIGLVLLTSLGFLARVLSRRRVDPARSGSGGRRARRRTSTSPAPRRA